MVTTMSTENDYCETPHHRPTVSMETTTTKETCETIPSDGISSSNSNTSTSFQYDIEASSSPTSMTTTTKTTTATNTNKKQQPQQLGSARTPWYGTSLLILSDVLGTGVLSLPFAAAKLGWILTIVCIVGCAYLAHYSAKLLCCVKTSPVATKTTTAAETTTKTSLPSAAVTSFSKTSPTTSTNSKNIDDTQTTIISYASAATVLIGTRFGIFTRICMILNWASLSIYYLVAIADSIGNISGTAAGTTSTSWLSCDINRTLVGAVLVLLATQVRDFHSLTKLAGPSFVAIIAVVIIILVTLVTDDMAQTASEGSSSSSSFGTETTIGPPSTTTPFDFLTAVSSIIFAYQGQSIFFEMMSEMKDSTQFPKSSGLSYVVMALSYAITVIVAYGTLGTSVPGFLPDALLSSSSSDHRHSTVAIVTGVLTCFHVLVAYVVTIQPIHIFLHTTFRPTTLYQSTIGGTRDWFLITVCTTTMAWIIANVIPFFAAIQSVVGSLFGAPIMFGWPTIFYLETKRRQTSTKSIKETLTMIGMANSILCGIMLFILTPFFVIVGTYGGMINLIQQAQDSGAPFDC